MNGQNVEVIETIKI